MIEEAPVDMETTDGGDSGSISRGMAFFYITHLAEERSESSGSERPHRPPSSYNDSTATV